MATLDTVKEVLESNLDIAPENVHRRRHLRRPGNRLLTWSSSSATSRRSAASISASRKASPPSVTSSSTSTTCKLSSPNERARICGLFSFLECAAGRKRVRQRENAGACTAATARSKGVRGGFDKMPRRARPLQQEAYGRSRRENHASTAAVTTSRQIVATRPTLKGWYPTRKMPTPNAASTTQRTESHFR